MPLPIINPLGAFGYTDRDDQLWSNDVTFETSGVVSAGYVVAMGTDGRVVNATSTQGTTNVQIGIAKEAAAAAGETILVCVEGYVSAAVQVDLSAGVAVRASTGGLVGTAATTAPNIGYTMDAITTTQATGPVWVSKSVV